MLGSYGVGWPLDKAGLQLLVVVPDEDAEPWQRVVLPFATSAVSWTVLMTARRDRRTTDRAAGAGRRPRCSAAPVAVG